MKSVRQSLGDWGEKLAANHLSSQGYEILDQKVRTPFGEIDLVARQDAELVFVEVKTRSSTRFGMPEESITPRKQEHMLACAEAYLQSHPEHTGNWRIDVIAIQRSISGASPIIVHFENALS